jgi:hypothetical protein
MPENTVYVGRPTKWGNPFWISRHPELLGAYALVCKDAQEAKEKYREFIEGRRAVLGCRITNFDTNELKGKNLACWCPLDKPCHADILLELANAKDGNSRKTTC